MDYNIIKQAPPQAHQCYDLDNVLSASEEILWKWGRFMAKVTSAYQIVR